MAHGCRLYLIKIVAPIAYSTSCSFYNRITDPAQVIWAPILTAITIPVTLVTHFMIVKRFNPPQQTLSYRGATDADKMDEVRLCPLFFLKVLIPTAANKMDKNRPPLHLSSF